MDEFKTVSLNPLTGPFDARSSADQQIPGGFSWKQNLQVSPDGKLQTAFGFSRPYDVTTIVQAGVPCSYQNWDYHNQGMGVLPANLEVPSLLFPSTANDGTRRLYMGTKTKFLLLDEVAGSWGVIGSGFGADGNVSPLSLRWKAAQLQDNIYLTNGFDAVQYTVAGSGSMAEVTGLQTAGESGMSAVAVTKPAVIITYSGVLMIMNMEEGGVRIPSRIRWSDLNDGTYWGTGTTNPNTNAASLSDYQDLDYGERILGATILLGYLYILTDRSIWQCSFSVDTLISPPQANLNCIRVYSEPRNKSRCLWYPNTLICDGESIYYAGHDAIYRYNLYMAVPERTEWIFLASSIVYDGLNGAAIDETSCQSPVMELWPDRKEIHFSWATPDATFVGAPNCNVQPPLVSSGLNRHTLVLNTEHQTCDYRDYGMVAYCNFQSSIVANSGQCPKGAQFFGVSGLDYCLKVFGPGCSREYYNYVAGTYAATGFVPILIGEFPFGQFDKDKEIKSFIVDGTVGADVGNVFNLQIGVSYSAMNIAGAVNSSSPAGNCGVLWHKLSSKAAKCLMAMTPAQYVAANLRPSYNHEWSFLYRGRFLYYWFTVTQANGSAPVAGPVTLTRIETKSILA